MVTWLCLLFQLSYFFFQFQKLYFNYASYCSIPKVSFEFKNVLFNNARYLFSKTYFQFCKIYLFLILQDFFSILQDSFSNLQNLSSIPEDFQFCKIFSIPQAFLISLTSFHTSFHSWLPGLGLTRRKNKAVSCNKVTAKSLTM